MDNSYFAISINRADCLFCFWRGKTKLTDILELKGISKSFGEKRVLDQVNLRVAEKSIFGFVGKNGSGKTTTMNIILGLLEASGGEVFVCGEKVKYGETKTNRHIGYLPDVPAFYDYMTAMEYLRLCGAISGLHKTKRVDKADDLLDLVGLQDEQGKIMTFSRGMKQRLGLAQALINEPKLLICDEPSSALDPIGRKKILDILLSIKGKTTVLFSSHILNDIERVCDRLAFLDKGCIQVQGDKEDLLSRDRNKKYLVQFSSQKDCNQFDDFLKSGKEKLSVEKDKTSLLINFANKQVGGSYLLDSFNQTGLVPLKFEKLETSLEDLFEEVVGWNSFGYFLKRKLLKVFEPKSS